MPQIIKTPQTKIVTKNGEIELSITVEPIVIELTLNISSDGNISVGETKASAQSIKVTEPEEEKTNWAVPSFGSSPKIKFGKNS